MEHQARRHVETCLGKMLWWLSEAQKYLANVVEPDYEFYHMKRFLRSLFSRIPEADRELKYLTKDYWLQEDELERERNVNDRLNHELSRQQREKRKLENELDAERIKRIETEEQVSKMHKELAYIRHLQNQAKEELYHKNQDKENLKKVIQSLEDKIIQLRQQLLRANSLKADHSSSKEKDAGILNSKLPISHDVTNKASTETSHVFKRLQTEKEYSRRLKEYYDTKCLQLTQELDAQKLEIHELRKNLKERQMLRDQGQTRRNEASFDKNSGPDNHLQRQLTETREQLMVTREKLKKTQQDLDYVKSRLSQVIGVKVTDNNPSLTDLSDKNRPTKISERYQELYDNQWTDAYETVQEIYKNEEKTIHTLRIILLDAMEFCKEQTVHQWRQIISAFSKGSGLPSALVKQLKDIRKSSAEIYGKELFAEYWTQLNTPYAAVARQIPHFVKECFHICWLMVVQDPPLVFGRELARNQPFNKDQYKAYTRSGDIVDFAVWPVMLLHGGGPVLCKGIAQALDGQSFPRPDILAERRRSSLHSANLRFSRQTNEERAYKTNIVHPLPPSTPSRLMKTVY